MRRPARPGARPARPMRCPSHPGPAQSLPPDESPGSAHDRPTHRRIRPRRPRGCWGAGGSRGPRLHLPGRPPHRARPRALARPQGGGHHPLGDLLPHRPGRVLVPAPHPARRLHGCPPGVAGHGRRVPLVVLRPGALLHRRGLRRRRVGERLRPRGDALRRLHHEAPRRLRHVRHRLLELQVHVGGVGPGARHRPRGLRRLPRRGHGDRRVLLEGGLEPPGLLGPLPPDHGPLPQLRHRLPRGQMGVLRHLHEEPDRGAAHRLRRRQRPVAGRRVGALPGGAHRHGRDRRGRAPPAALDPGRRPRGPRAQRELQDP